MAMFATAPRTLVGGRRCAITSREGFAAFGKTAAEQEQKGEAALFDSLPGMSFATRHAEPSVSEGRSTLCYYLYRTAICQIVVFRDAP